MRSQTIYQIYGGNCDEENDIPGPVAFRTKRSATKIAEECAREIAVEADCEVEPVKMDDGFMRFNLIPRESMRSFERAPSNWWYVVKVTLKD
jgi:hypothetical protein